MRGRGTTVRSVGSDVQTKGVSPNPYLTRFGPWTFVSFCVEVKFEPEHVVEDMSYVEPITQDTVKKLQKPMVQKTASGPSGTSCGGSH